MVASQTGIKAAYRKKALQLHPDVSDAPDATERFAELSAAYGACHWQTCCDSRSVTCLTAKLIPVMDAQMTPTSLLRCVSSASALSSWSEPPSNVGMLAGVMHQSCWLPGGARQPKARSTSVKPLYTLPNLASFLAPVKAMHPPWQGLTPPLACRCPVRPQVSRSV